MRIGVLTSGGDAPGMNAAIWRIERAVSARGDVAVGIRDGFAGLLAHRAQVLDPWLSARFARLGGTALGTARLADLPAHLGDIVAAIDALDVGALVVLGGNGSLAASQLIAARAQVPVVGIPATIDNDVGGTDLSLGFDTAVNYGLDVADRLRDTAESLPRFFALETLGGPTGHIAAAVGRLAGAVTVLIPERPVDQAAATRAVAEALSSGAHALAVASEGVTDLDDVLNAIADGVSTRLRLVRLGHAQRGGVPSVRDRALATASAEMAVRAIADGQSGIAVLTGSALRLVAFADHRDASPPDLEGWRGLL